VVVQSHTSAPDALRTLEVLVVDDDAMIRSYVAEILSDEGYVALQAINGRQALDLLVQRDRDGRRPPDLILLDMRMPIMDGWAFAEAYRSLPLRHAPIVVITAAHDAEVRAAQIRADGVLSKPFDLEQLLDTVAGRVGR
jgi:two-component system chemotaxis response regulator CheY